MPNINDLKKAVSVVAKVRAASADEANKKIQEVEDAIRDLHVPVKADMYEEMIGGETVSYRLVYIRVSESWSLEIEVSGKRPIADMYPWKSAPAVARIAVANNIERFTAAALEVARKCGRSIVG